MTSDKQHKGIELKEVIHLYLGCKVMYAGMKNPRDLTGEWLGSLIRKDIIRNIKPILRPLSDMTEEEKAEHEKIYFADNFKLMPWYHDTKFISMAWFLKKGFDVFGLIESNQAIDKTLLP